MIDKKEVISKLELMRCNSEWNKDFNKALDVAIKVLRRTNIDCINRQQAVEAIEGVDWYHVNSKGELVHGSTSDEESWYKAKDIYKAIESLPPVTSTERTGKWIVERYCSECEWDKKDAELVCNIPTNYCPNCGARMI